MLRSGAAKKKLFDRILLDAPCSGTGVIRRHQTSNICAVKAILPHWWCVSVVLEAMWRLLKADGVLLYTTCSILPQENEQMITDFLSRNTRMLKSTP